MSNELFTEAQRMQEQLRQWRRHLHAHPELSAQEQQTSAYVAGELKKMGYRTTERVGGTFGLTVHIGSGSDNGVALRADMDALPIQEETGLPFASTNPGVMHACGHDAHTAMLLGAASLLARRQERLRRPVTLIFQPAEEAYPGGAAPMIAAGALRGVAEIFGLHISSQLPCGVLGTRNGPFMSSVNKLEITVHGKGGHAAMPEQCIDPVVVAAQIILALQTVVSRSIAMTDQAVVSVTQVNAGTADNVIPEVVRMCGTVRTLDEGVRLRVCAKIGELAPAIAASHGARAQVVLEPGYPVLVNDARIVEKALAAARTIGFAEQGLQQIPAQGGGEDFAYYCQKTAGAFAFLGARTDSPGAAYPHHHPKFDIDESALPSGAALLAQYALDAAG